MIKVRKFDVTIAFKSKSFSSALQVTINKTVLLRERKRHTARRVASTPLLSYPRAVPHSWLGGGTQSLVSWLPVTVLTWPGGTTSWGTPWKGTWDQWKYYGMEMGYPQV